MLESHFFRNSVSNSGKKGEIVSNYNYVRIWEIDSDHKWNVLLEVFSAVEQ